MPQGAAFVELYNPWSPAGQLPAELYSQLTRDATGYAKAVQSQGVELGRLSNYGVDTTSGEIIQLNRRAEEGVRPRQLRLRSSVHRYGG